MTKTMVETSSVSICRKGGTLRAKFLGLWLFFCGLSGLLYSVTASVNISTTPNFDRLPLEEVPLLKNIRPFTNITVLYNETAVVELKNLMETNRPDKFSCKLKDLDPQSSASVFIHTKLVAGAWISSGFVAIDSHNELTRALNHHKLYQLVCSIDVLPAPGQSIDDLTVIFDFRVSILSKDIDIYERKSEFDHMVWQVKPNSRYKVPMDFTYVFSNSIRGVQNKYLFNNATLLPEKSDNITELVSKPVVSNMMVKNTSMQEHPYYKTVLSGMRNIVGILALDGNYILLSELYIQALPSIHVSIFKAPDLEKLFSQSDAMQVHNFLSTELDPGHKNVISFDQGTVVEMIKISPRKVIFNSKIANGNKKVTYFNLMDLDQEKTEEFVIYGYSLSGCVGLDQHFGSEEDQTIVDCLAWNPKYEDITDYVSLRICFKPFSVYLRKHEDMRVFTYPDYAMTEQISLKQISLTYDTRATLNVTIMGYLPHVNMSILRVYSISATENENFGKLDTGPLVPLIELYTFGEFDRFCSHGKASTFWVNSTDVMNSAHMQESLIYASLKDSLIQNPRFRYHFCLEEQRYMITISESKLRTLGQTYFSIYNTRGRYTSPARILFDQALRMDTLLAADVFVSRTDAKAGYIFYIFSDSSKKPVLGIMKYQLDYPSIRLLNLNTASQKDQVQTRLMLFGTHQKKFNVSYITSNPDRLVVQPLVKQVSFFGGGSTELLSDLFQINGSIVSIGPDKNQTFAPWIPEEQTILAAGFDDKYEFVWEQALKLHNSRLLEEIKTKPWQIAIHKSTMYVIEQKTAMLHLFNITDKLTNPTESLRFGSGSICLGVTSPKIEVLTVDETTILILSNSGFKRGYEDLMYCVFAIANRPERQLVKLTSLSGRTGDYFLKVRQTPKHGTLFCFYNEQEISLEVVDFLRTEVSRHDTFNQYSLTSLALIDSNPFHHVMTNFHNVDYWIDPQDGLMYIFACSSYRTSFILPHKLYTIEGKTKYYPVFEKKIRFEYLDRLISADCKSSGVQFECVCATQNLNIIHRRYVRVQNGTETPSTTDPRPDFELKDEIEYEMPTHGTLQKICVLTRHLVVIFKEEKTLYTVVFEKWRKYSLQHLTLNFESDELLDCNIDESTLPATDKLYYLNSFKRVYAYNISAPMLKRKLRKSNATNTKWFSLQDDQSHKDEISLRVKGINSTVVLRLPTSRVHAKTHWKALLFLVLCLVGLVLSRVLGELWYFTKTKYEFLGKSMLEYEEGTASLYSKPLVHEDEESANYLSFILRD